MADDFLHNIPGATEPNGSEKHHALHKNVQHYAPSWLVSDWDAPEGTDPEAVQDGVKILWAMSALIDAMCTRLEQSTRMRMPSLCAVDSRESAAKYFEINRAIPRGRSEDLERYAARLTQWRAGHKSRGTAWALLMQLHNYFGPQAPGDAGALVRSVNARGYEHTISETGEFTKITRPGWDAWVGSPGGYLGDGLARAWLIIVVPALVEPTPDLGDPELWGGSLSGTHLVGLAGSMTRDDILAVRNMLYGAHPWRPAGMQPQWLVFPLYGGDGDQFGFEPTANWSTWSRIDGGTRTRTRGDEWRYVAAHERALDYYPTAQWSDASEMPGGSVYTLAETWHDGPVTMANLEDYTPVAQWHESARLVDDGTITT